MIPASADHGISSPFAPGSSAGGRARHLLRGGQGGDRRGCRFASAARPRASPVTCATAATGCRPAISAAPPGPSRHHAILLWCLGVRPLAAQRPRVHGAHRTGPLPGSAGHGTEGFVRHGCFAAVARTRSSPRPARPHVDRAALAPVDRVAAYCLIRGSGVQVVMLARCVRLRVAGDDRAEDRRRSPWAASVRIDARPGDAPPARAGAGGACRRVASGSHDQPGR